MTWRGQPKKPDPKNFEKNDPDPDPTGQVDLDSSLLPSSQVWGEYFFAETSFCPVLVQKILSEGSFYPVLYFSPLEVFSRAQIF